MTRFFVPVALSAIGVGAHVSGEVPSSHIVYVSPQGNDMANGQTRETAFRSLERAGAAVQAGNADTVLLTGGVFRRGAPFTIRPSPRAQRWAAAPGETPVLDGEGKTGEALLVTGHDVTVEGLTITNFTGNGIVVGDADGIVIAGNRVTDIASKAWTKAAILMIQNARSVTVRNNLIRDTGYVGIGYFASKEGDLHGTRVLGNDLARTCRQVPDCGAIYVDGRTPSANGAVIRGNRIADYGVANHETKAIYLDDGLSGAMVSHNEISGSGTYAFQIHGGSDNRITRNVVDLPAGQSLLFHQEMEGPLARPMRGNLVEDNSVRSAGSGPLPIKYGGTSRPILRNNRRQQ